MKLINNIKILICAALSSLLCTSCLDGNDAESVVTNYFNAIVTSFKLQSDTNVADGLDKVEFTIDNYGLSDAAIHAKFPNDGIIFNPDSLPYGTIADSVKVTVSYSQPDSAFFCLYSLDNRLRQFSFASADSALYFASFPDARLTLSARGARKTYHIKINVHKVAGDTINWRNYTEELWANTALTDQRVDTLGQKAFWYVESGTQNQVITADIITRPNHWTEPATVTVEGGELLDLQTLYHWHNALYAVGKQSGALLSSADGYNWQVTNADYQFASILGNQLATKDVYGNWNQDSLSVIVRHEDSYRFAVSANGKDWRIDKVIPTGFPIKGFTRPISVAARAHNGNITSRLYIIGGMTADGQLTSSTWSCDGFSEIEKGRNWAEFTHGNIPTMQCGTVIEYTLDQDRPRSLWILHPGILDNGQIAQSTHYGRRYATLYYSEDNGVSWHDLYAKYPKMADNSAFAALAPNSAFVNPANYEIYYFGGMTAEGGFGTTVWGGQLPSLAFIKVR